ncbi:MAG: ABC transporter permease [Armatimonadetes bacterium]|nr:ABC transporter permease [Armatimonadota bacterium]
MQRYLARRVLQMIPVLLLIATVIFVVIRLKGDPISQLAPVDIMSKEEIDDLRRAYGFDRPITVQYLDFIVHLPRGDFGESFRYRQPAFPLVIERLPKTMQLAGAAVLIGWGLALPLGVVAALRRNSLTDLVATTLSVLGRALPNFWLGIMLILVFAVGLAWLPVSGSDTGWNLLLPAVTLGVGLATTLTRLIRSSMLEVIRQDYVQTARSKGLSQRTVVLKHALRNGLIPVFTVFGLQVAYLLGGVIIVEQVFAWPGMGQLMVKAVLTRDMAIVQAGVFVFAVVVMASNLLVDLLYTFLDPRIRYE